MSQRTSLATGKKYGLRRICTVWDLSRSTFYSKQARIIKNSATTRSRPGPKTDVSDDMLLKLIRQDLENSLFNPHFSQTLATICARCCGRFVLKRARTLLNQQGERV